MDGCRRVASKQGPFTRYLRPYSHHRSQMTSGHRDRSRSSSSERLPGGVQEISEKDFFLKNDEFRLWLKEEKDKVPLLEVPAR